MICHRVKFSGGLELLEFILQPASDLWSECAANGFRVVLILDGVE